MKVGIGGLQQEMTPEEYADIATERFRQQLADALHRLGDRSDVSLPDPGSFASSVSDVIWGLPDQGRNELVALLGPFWSAGKTRQALGLKTRQALNERRRAGTVLGLRTSDGEIVYPVSQFMRHDAGVQVRPALVGLFRTLREHDPWAVATLLHAAAPELGGQTPLERARLAGADEDVLLDLARAVDREWRAGAA